jgi:hypothetical protein
MGKQKFSGIAVCSAERRSLSLNRPSAEVEAAANDTTEPTLFDISPEHRDEN